MAHINFLESPKFSLSQFSLKNFELNYFWLMIIAGCLLALMMTYGVVQRYRVGALNLALEVAVAEAQKAKGKPVQTGAVSSTLMAGLQNRIKWSLVINAIANHTPDTVALQHIQGNSASRAVSLEGISPDVAAASRYEESLSKAPPFSKVLLQSTSTRSATGETSGEKGEDAAKKPATPAAVGAGKEQLVFNIKGWLK